MLRILLADDHLVVRHGFRILLEREGFEVVGEASDGQEAVRLAQATHPDVAVLDLSMPHVNGLEAAKQIREACPKTAIVLLTMYSEEHQVTAALRAGVGGYVEKSQAADDLTAAIRAVAEGTVYLGPRPRAVVVGAMLADGNGESGRLAPRERSVLQLIAEGHTTEHIASMLGVSVKTCATYRARLMQKLNIHNVAGLVRYAIRHGLVHSALISPHGFRDPFELLALCDAVAWAL